MTIEVTETGAPNARQGAPLAVFPLPYIKHSVLAIGTALQFDPRTRYVRLVPGEDCRIHVARAAGDLAPANGMPLKSGQVYDFEVQANHYIKAA